MEVRGLKAPQKKKKKLERPQITFNLFPKTFLGFSDQFKLYKIFQYKIPEVSAKLKVKERVSGTYRVEELQNEFQDVTGVSTAWNSELCLAKILLSQLQNAESFLKVLEVGAGHTGLAGFFASKVNANFKVVISDGNPECVQNLEEIKNMNSMENVEIKQI